MRKLSLVLALGVLSLAASTWAEEKTEKVSIDVPVAVKTTLTREAGDAKIVELQRMQGEQGVNYVAIISEKGKEYEIQILEDGRLMRKGAKEQEEQKELTLEEMPPAVKATLEKEAQGAKIGKIEKEEAKTTYSTRVVIKGEAYDIRVDKDGKLVEKVWRETEEKKD